jgi:hypothetical protein
LDVDWENSECYEKEREILEMVLLSIDAAFVFTRHDPSNLYA